MATDDEKVEEILDHLQKEYDLTAARRNTLTGQATNLTGFAGIIDAILIALLIGISMDGAMREMITRSSFYPALFASALIGFVSYSIAVVFALLAYWETKWIPAPTIPAIENQDDMGSVVFFLNNPQQYSSVIAALQLKRGSEYNATINATKYKLLNIAQAALMVGIVATAAVGLTLLRIVSP